MIEQGTIQIRVSQTIESVANIDADSLAHTIAYPCR
jgi:hypothetical protein